MITPFLPANTEAGGTTGAKTGEGGLESGPRQIDFAAVDRLVEWYIASGCAGIFSPCLSSEMYDLSTTECVQLAQHIHQKVSGRCAVVSTGT